jgi:hypothetical protein
MKPKKPKIEPSSGMIAEGRGLDLDIAMPITDTWVVWCRQRGLQGKVELKDGIVQLMVRLDVGEYVVWVEGPPIFVEGFVNGLLLSDRWKINESEIG